MADNVVIDITAKDNVSGAAAKVASSLSSVSKEVDSLAIAQAKGITMQKAYESGFVTLEQRMAGTVRQIEEQNRATMLEEAAKRRSAMAARFSAEAEQQQALATKQAAEAAKQAEASHQSFTKSIVGIATAVTGTVMGLQAVGRIMRESIDVATNYQTKLLGLSTITNNFGLSQKDVQGAIQQLTANGLLTQADAVGTLTNVFSKYVTDADKAVELIMAFENAAATGGDSSLSFSQKVQNLSEAFLTEMSQLGNNSGMQENWNDVIKVGEKITGQKIEKLNQLQRTELLRVGTLEVLKRAQGGVDSFMKTNVGTIQMMTTNTNNLKLALGNNLMPALSILASLFQGGSASGQLLTKVFKGVGIFAVALASSIKLLATEVMNFIKIAAAAMSLSSDNLKAAVKDAAMATLQVGADAQQAIADIQDGVQQTANKAKGGLADWLSDTSTAAKKAMEDINKENEKYARDLKKRNEDFMRSLGEAIRAHQDKVKEIKKQIDDETQAFTEANAKRVKDYEDSLAKMEKAHLRKVRDLNQNVSDEDKAYAKKKDDINQQIAEETQKGVMIEGVWNSQANQSRLAELRARLAEEEDMHQQRLAEIQQNLSDENQDYQDALTEKKTTFEEETAKAKEENDKRIADLQTELQQENELLAKHKDEVAMVKDQMVEDDITRLVRQHQEESDELATAHKEQLKSITDAAKAGAGSWKDNFTDPVLDMNKKIQEEAKKDLEQMAKDVKTESTTMGKNWLEGAISGMKIKFDELQNKLKSSGSGVNLDTVIGASGVPINNFGEVLNTLTKQHGGIVPGAIGQPVPIIAHGGERVVPTTGTDVNSSRVGGNNITINLNGTTILDNYERMHELASEISNILGRRSELSSLSAGY